eukprot:g16686.t1
MKVGLVEGALAPLRRAHDAIQGAKDLKTNMGQRYGDYSYILEALKSKPKAVTGNEIGRELRRLTEFFTRVAELLEEYTAAPADGSLTKGNIKAKRATDYKEVNKELDEIDREVIRQLAIMNLKGAISTSEMEVVQGVDEKVDRPTSLVNDMRPPSLPEMASVPAGALVLPHSYVERAAVQEVADGLTNPDEPCTPYTVVGMSGGGKSVLASAVVRKSSVRKHFLEGIFWMGVGRGAKNAMLDLLQGLARDVGAAPTDTPRGVPYVLDSLEQVQQYLGKAASTGSFPRLVVLDDVWEREVVDALLLLGLKVLVTTRDRSVVGVPTGLLELGDMTDEEARELLLKTSKTVGQPGDGVRTQMTKVMICLELCVEVGCRDVFLLINGFNLCLFGDAKCRALSMDDLGGDRYANTPIAVLYFTRKVVALCGRLPLVLAIAGSMPAVKGKALTAGAWAKLIDDFDDVAERMRTQGEQSTSIKLVLETSLDALSRRTQRQFLKMAVLAAGAVAPVEMLRNLWEIEDAEGTQEQADGLVRTCLLQLVTGVGYRVHDLVLEFLQDNIKPDVVDEATALQVAYLRRLDKLEGYRDRKPCAGNQGLFVLGCFWRAVEKLSEDPGLEVTSYRISLDELEPLVYGDAISLPWFLPTFLQSSPPFSPKLRDTAADVARSYSSVGRLFELQGKYAEADRLYLRAIEIGEKTLGPDHPNLATRLNNRAVLLKSQGKCEEAGPLYKRSLAIDEKVYGPDHPEVGIDLNNWAALLERQGKYEEADRLYLRAIEIGENTPAPDHPNLATMLNNRAGLLKSQRKYEEADRLYLRAIEIGEKTLGPDHPDLATRLNNRAELLKSQGKYEEAGPLYKRSLAIDEKVYGPDHPEVGTDLNNWAALLERQRKYEEADRLYLRAIEIGENTLGPDHPRLASRLNNRAGLLKSQGEYAEADRLYLRAIEIGEKMLGGDHSHLAVWLSNRAGLSESQEKFTEAIPLLERAISIRMKKLGGSHPETVSSHNSLEVVR